MIINSDVNKQYFLILFLLFLTMNLRIRRFASSFNFDTYRLVQRLEAEGFTREGSEAIMNSLSEVVEQRWLIHL